MQRVRGAEVRVMKQRVDYERRGDTLLYAAGDCRVCDRCDLSQFMTKQIYNWL
jgi:hypothetical protein